MYTLKKGYIITAGGAISAGLIAGYLLLDKENKNKLKERFNDYTRGILRKDGYKQYSTLEEAGIPDQLDRADLAQVENSKMVSEGSQYGVHYYNMYQEEETKDIQH